jgi:hypothetical protein
MGSNERAEFSVDEPVMHPVKEDLACLSLNGSNIGDLPSGILAKPLV